MYISNMLVQFASGFLGVLLGSISTLFLVKTLVKREKIMDITEDIVRNSIDMVINDVEMQKQVYSIGVLLGNGLKTGLGIQKGTGKFKLQDVIAQGAGMFLQNLFSKQMTQTTQSAQSTSGSIDDALK